MPEAIRGATVQAAPVFLDLDANLDNTVGLIEEAGANGPASTS